MLQDVSSVRVLLMTGDCIDSFVTCDKCHDYDE